MAIRPQETMTVSRAIGLGSVWEPPDIIQFVTGPQWLDRTLYPRQATLLKLIFLQMHLMTDYDYRVIDEWSKGFVLDNNRDDDSISMHYKGDWGIVPDVLERVEYLKENGYRWFRLVLSVMGRRSGKGYIGALCEAYVLWNYLCLPNPKLWFGIDRDKRITTQVFAGKKLQARDNQWRDISNVIVNAPCFRGFISGPLGESLTVFARSDLMESASIHKTATSMDQATFEIVPKEATTMAARGPASRCLDPRTLVLTTDLEWVPVGSLKPGDALVGVDEKVVTGKQRKLRESVVKSVWRERQPTLKITFDDGTSVTCSANHRWLLQYTSGGGNKFWREAGQIKSGDAVCWLVDPWQEDRSRDGGYLAGAFDGEGCIVSSGNREMADILFSQNPGPMLDAVVAKMKSFGFNMKMNTRQPTCQQWALRGVANSMRFLGQFRPVRLLEKARYIWEGRTFINHHGRGYKIVASVEQSDEMELVDIETSTKTFFANGFVSHNSQFYDEGAHMSATGVSRSMEEVWEAATPALDQFGNWAFIYSGSSPWAMSGKFYELCQQTLSVDADSGKPVYPEHLMIQLESWDIYKDWQMAVDGEFVLAPARKGILLENDQTTEIDLGPTYAPRLRGAIQEYDASMQRLERANPDTFRVERRAKWAVAMDAYFPEEHVRRVFRPWNGATLEQKRSGPTNIRYTMHGDPGKTGSNFGFAVAHAVPDPDGHPIPHVVFDFVRGWVRADFDNMEMDYLKIEEEIGELMDGFVPTDVSFDQWNCLHGDSLVQTRHGMVPIRTLVGDDVAPGSTVDIGVEVPTKDGWGVAARGFHRGVIPTRRIRTKLGNEIEVSREHRLWVERDGEWRWMEGQHIRQGDRLLARRNTSLPGEYMHINPLPFDTRSKSVAPAVLDRDLGWLMGFMVAEGWVGEKNWSITQKSVDNLERATKVCANVFGGGDWNFTYDDDLQGKYQCGRVSGGASTAKFFNWVGCGGGAQSKVVPWAIWQSPRNVIESFLSGLFDGDGGVTITKDKGEWVHYETTSVKLAEQVQQLLWSVGVFCTIWRGTYQYKGETRGRARITIYGDDLVAFHRNVGFSDGAKSERLDEAVRRSMGRSSYRRRSRSIDGDDYAVKVISVVESEADCYDIEVPGDESFIANGVVSHNSISMIQRLTTRTKKSFRPANVWERTATAPLNWRTAETFKVALSLNRVHAPYNSLAELEMLFLRKIEGRDAVDHPDTGPCTTKDVWDAMSICVHKLIGQDVANAYGEMFSQLRVAVAIPGMNTPVDEIGRAAPMPTDKASKVAAEFSRFSQDRLLAHRQQGRGLGGPYRRF